MSSYNWFGFSRQSNSNENHPLEGNTNNQPSTQGPGIQHRRNPFLKDSSDPSGRKYHPVINRDEPIVEGIGLS